MPADERDKNLTPDDETEKVEDLEANVIRVERSWDRVEGFITVKSGAGRRTVPIPRVLRPQLVAHRLATGATRARLRHDPRQHLRALERP